MTLKEKWAVEHDTEVVSLAELEELLLRQRGLTDARQQAAFFEPSYKRDIHDPLALYGMAEAVDRVFSARDKHEKVLVYGDYDADGITSTAIMLFVLQQLGIPATPFIPDRHDHGYGLHQGVLSEVAGDVSLVITVDCGVTAVEEVAWLKQRGIDTIIVDHHEVPAELPAAVALIHPNHPAGTYPTKNLCGAGTAWKLASALLTDSRSPAAADPDAPKWLLDLAALGTIADMVPLQGENRNIVQFGLEILRRTDRPGVRELVRSATKQPAKLSVEDVSWQIISKLNAAGRIDHAQPALELLLAEDASKATELLTNISALNRRRQNITKKIVQEAEAQITDPTTGVLFAYSPEWPAGVVGLAANKLARKFSRPSFIVGAAGEQTVGSVRSPKGHDVLKLLAAGEDILLKFGGHRQAAGFTVAPDKVAALADRLQQAVPSSTGAAETISADCILAPELVSFELIKRLKRFEPFGEGNPTPQFLLQNVSVVEARVVGKTQEHLKYLFRVGDEPVEGIGFGLAKEKASNSTKQKVDMIARVEENEFRGRRSLQLSVQTIAPAGAVVRA